MKIQEFIEFTPEEVTALRAVVDIAESIMDTARTPELKKLGYQIYDALAQIDLNHRVETTITINLDGEEGEYNAD